MWLPPQHFPQFLPKVLTRGWVATSELGCLLLHWDQPGVLAAHLPAYLLPFINAPPLQDRWFFFLVSEHLKILMW